MSNIFIICTAMLQDMPGHKAVHPGLLCCAWACSCCCRVIIFI